MQLAISLADQVDPHLTMPNPRVGCVLVCDGEIVGAGAHQRCGEAHAEVLALSPDLPKSGLEIYLTLEPCDHFHGKQTPSCTELIIQAKPKKVYVGALDPKFQGQNLEKLKSAAIDVEYLDSDECRELNPFLEKYHSESPYPYVTLKIAQSLDGKITSADKYITNELSRAKVHELRAQYGAVLTSTETIEQDDPLLDVRLESSPDLPKSGLSSPKVVIVGTRELSLDQKVFTVSERDVFEFRTQNLEKVLLDVKAEGIDSVLIEVGQTLNTEFLGQGLVDEIQMFIAPVLLGDGEKSAFSSAFPAQAGIQLLKKFRLREKESLNRDVWSRYVRD